MSSDRVLERFPEHRRRILELRLSDRNVADISEDLGDVAEALERITGGNDERAAETRSELLRQRAALEEEVVELLAADS